MVVCSLALSSNIKYGLLFDFFSICLFYPVFSISSVHIESRKLIPFRLGSYMLKSARDLLELFTTCSRLTDDGAHMNLLAIVGSPRRRKATDTLVDRAIEGFLSATPEAGVKKIRLAGDTPSPVRPPSGCHFHPRCPEAMEKCSREYPHGFDFSGTHSARCWLYEGGEEGKGER